MEKVTITMMFFSFCFLAHDMLADGLKVKANVDWWCDETECFYIDTMPNEDKCDSNNSIPYRFNSTTGNCELNLIGLLLFFKVLNNRLGAVVQEKNSRRSEKIFQGLINSGKAFAGFASVCIFIGCFYCCWVQYSDRKLRKSLKVVAKMMQAQQKNKAKQNVEEKENKGNTERYESITEEAQISIV